MAKYAANLESKQLDLDKPYLSRSPFLDPRSRAYQPILVDTARWRLIASEPVNKLAVRLIVREISSLNWRIKPLDNEHADAVTYYTNLLGNFRELAAKSLRNICILPQGGAWEVGWVTPGVYEEGERGTPSFIKFIDAGTLHPTVSDEFPIVQIDPHSQAKVLFKENEIVRLIAFPYDEFDKEWWQESPTMASFLAIEALSRIYIYYLKQLRDTPLAGILDLMDFSEDDAKNWAHSFREMLEGIDPIKIPILYEHTQAANWLPMGRNPADLAIPTQFKMFAEIVLANYGLSLADLRLFDQGQSKAGAIVNRKITTQSGISFFAELVKDAVQAVLPHYLLFEYTDPDIDEDRSRAQIRSADARTVQTLNFLPVADRVRQLKEWGTLTIDIDPEETEKKANEMMQQAAQMQAPKGSLKPGQLERGEGRTVDNLEEDAKQNAAGSTRYFAKSEAEEQLPATVKMDVRGLIEKAAYKLKGKKVKKVKKERQVYGKKLKEAETKLEKLLRQQFAKAGKRITVKVMDELLEKIYTQFPSAILDTTIKDTVVKSHIDLIETIIYKADEEPPAFEDLTPNLQQRIEEMLELLLEDMDELEISEEEVLQQIVEIYRIAYEEGLLALAEQVKERLFEQGLSDSPYFEIAFNLTNQGVLDFLTDKAAELVTNINDGTKFFLRKLISEGVERGMSSPEIVDMIQSQLFGLDPEEASKLSESRIRSIVNTEINRAESNGRLEQMRKLGFTLKRWITRLIDVCSLCLRNEAEGSVPLDFLYEDVFGETLTPPGHPSTCHCSLGADGDELENIGTDVEFWYGD
jgi:hypothetical protein